MNTFDEDRSIADLTAEIQRESEPDQLVDSIMLTIFGADMIPQPIDEESQPKEIK